MIDEPVVLVDPLVDMRSVLDQAYVDRSRVIELELALAREKKARQLAEGTQKQLREKCDLLQNAGKTLTADDERWLFVNNCTATFTQKLDARLRLVIKSRGRTLFEETFVETPKFKTKFKEAVAKARRKV